MAGRFDFIAPGAAAADAIRQEMIRRQELQQQQQMDQLAMDREERAAAQQIQQMKMQQEELKLNQKQQEMTLKQQEAQQLDTRRKAFESRIKTMKKGEADPAVIKEAKELGYGHLFQEGLPTQGADLGADGQGVDQYEVIPGVMEFAGTPQQQATEALLSDPNVSQNVKTFIKARSAADNEAIPYQLFDTPEDKTKIPFRVSADKRTIEKQNTDGSWTPHVGPLPANAQLLNEPQPDDTSQSPYSAAMAEYMGLLAEEKRRGLGGVNAFGVTLPAEYAKVAEAATANLQGEGRRNRQRVIVGSYDPSNQESFNQSVVKAGIDSEPVARRNDIEGRIDLLASIDEIENVLGVLKITGTPTNIISGTFEDWARYVGATTNPELAALRNRLDIIRVQWRRAMTGVQFSQAEDDNYKKMFPNYKNVPAVNESLLRAMRTDQSLTHNNFWNRKLGADGAKLVGVTYDRTPSSGTGTMTSPDVSKATSPTAVETSGPIVEWEKGPDGKPRRKR